LERGLRQEPFREPRARVSGLRHAGHSRNQQEKGQYM